MKVLIAHNYSEISFAAMSYHFSHFLAESGNEVFFISHSPYLNESFSSHIGKGEITVTSWPKETRPTGLGDFLWYGWFFLKHRPKIIIGHFVGSNITITVSKILSFGTARTYEYYHTLSSQLKADRKKEGFRDKLLFMRKKCFYRWFCDVIICPSELAKTDFEKRYGAANTKVLLNPMADRFEDKIQVSENDIIISYLGRLDPSKGVVDLITAFKLYKQHVPDSKIKLRIAGTGSQQQHIMDLISGQDDIQYMGGLPYGEIDRYLQQGHFTIIPSKWDTMPVTGLESMMNQVPLLVSNGAGLSQYLTEDKECFKFDPDVDSTVKLFKKVEENIHKHPEMCINARKTFADGFTMEQYCRQFLDIIS
ncbi:MAG: hypothetical protein CFE23_07555 [Flavobacterium sp. BFFFF1]|uniref:glycosyltransferase family 4 protein n=1 Tax=Flavobacterium sp. BFFFF1 TaxID=2015557 RepID=UPI000BCD5CF6|nr:glycosyltransferase [Flavobacterium sp. BFFFF1]OYU80813.1 MAG: hypothetical protein CFE23_07555 [Flavobacterium sp. BFFFF1]